MRDLASSVTVTSSLTLVGVVTDSAAVFMRDLASSVAVLLRGRRGSLSHGRGRGPGYRQTRGGPVSEPTDDLRERAREHVRQMPAETALGNADPAGGSTDDPKIMDQAAREEGEQQS
jgi:hypothetical protein